MRYEVKRKRNIERLHMPGICFDITYSQKVSVNSRQRIPGPSCARKETVGIYILVTSRNGDRKIMKSIRIMSRPFRE